MIVQRLILILFLLPLFAGESVAQCLMVPGFEQQQFADASQIFEGRVTAQNAFLGDDGNIYTSNHIEVYRVLKGAVADEVSLITAGGIVGNTMQVVTPSVSIKPNGYGLFVAANTNGLKQAMSFYQIDEETNHVYGTQIANAREELYEAVARVTGSSNIELRRVPISTRTENARKSVVQIASVDPQNTTAGTRTLLTISGEGFGAEQGAGHVAFSNANDGGQSFVILQPGPHYVTWSDTEIQLYVPSASLFNSTVAGTGNLEVRNSAGQTVLSNQQLHIDYAKSEVIYEGNLNNTILVAPQNGGYDFQTNQAFFNLLGNTEVLEQTFEKWSCNTGVNFRLGDEVANSNDWQNDGINLIGLSAPGQLPPNMLGRTVTTFSGCGSANNLQWNLIDVDILLNIDINWYTGDGTPPSDKFDLPTSILHELGHAHLLQHNNDADSPMYFQLTAGSSRRQLSPVADISGGAYVVDEASLTQSTCSEEFHQPHDNSDCNLSLINSIVEEEQVNVKAYPNPFSDELFIDLITSEIEQIILIDQLGRVVRKIIPSVSVMRLSTDELPPGVYVLQIETPNQVVSERLVKN